MVIRFIGYNNHKNIGSSGEKNFLNHVCKTKPTICLDIGANVGNYSQYILENSLSKVIAFEPIPKSFNKLKILKKNYKGRFFIYNIGIGNKNHLLYGNKSPKKTMFYDNNNLQWASFSPELKEIDYLKNSNKSIKCHISTLDTFLSKNKKLINKKIDLIKIDTEGYELEVLNGAKKAIKKYKPKYIQIEYNWHHLFKNVNLYYFSKINPKRPENNYFNYSNIVFIRK